MEPLEISPSVSDGVFTVTGSNNYQAEEIQKIQLLVRSSKWLLQNSKPHRWSHVMYLLPVQNYVSLKERKINLPAVVFCTNPVVPKVLKAFHGRRSGHFGIFPASEVSILPSSGSKNVPIAEDLLVSLTLKVLSFIFFCVAMTLEYNED